MLENLKALGFTEYEARIFISVLKGELRSASKIADDANVRRTDVYPVLKSFVEKGYVNEIETNSIFMYEMIDPGIVMDKIKKDINRRKEKELSTLADTFTALKPLYKSVPEEKKPVNVELIRGYNQHREVKFIKLLKEAKKEILFMVRLEHFVSDDIDLTAAEFIKQGGTIRSVYQYGENFRIKKGAKWHDGTTKDLIDYLQKYSLYGEEIKLSREAVPNITIFDRETVFMNIIDKEIPKHNEADVIVRNKSFAKSMIAVFNSFWKNSIKLENFKSEIKIS